MSAVQKKLGFAQKRTFRLNPAKTETRPPYRQKREVQPRRIADIRVRQGLTEETIRHRRGLS